MSRFYSARAGCVVTTGSHILFITLIKMGKCFPGSIVQFYIKCGEINPLSMLGGAHGDPDGYKQMCRKIEVKKVPESELTEYARLNTPAAPTKHPSEGLRLRTFSSVCLSVSAGSFF